MSNRESILPADHDVEWIDPVIEAYKRDVDVTLIRENLKLTVEQRLKNLEAAQRDIELLRNAVKSASRGA